MEGHLEYAGMKRTVQVIGWVLTFASIYAICNIELDWFWSIPVRYNPENINRVLLNLSYSYLAGYIFYLLVTEIPYLHRKQRFCKLLSKKYDSLKNQIETHIQAFDTKEHYHLDKELLFRYAVVEEVQNQYLVVIYKDYQCQWKMYKKVKE